MLWMAVHCYSELVLGQGHVAVLWAAIRVCPGVTLRQLDSTKNDELEISKVGRHVPFATLGVRRSGFTSDMN